ncbi:MAG: hypothetical protein HY289_12765 [Planctomycetes bacterium]|nr:hypothetical protein [Planctomycetota bacterium]
MMHRSIFALTVFLLLSGAGVAAPARPLYEPALPPPPPPPPRIINLAGTAWVGKYNAINRIFVFESDGTLSYKSPAGKAAPFKNRGSWRMEGNVLIFEHFVNPNTKLMHFRGTIRDDNSIVGEANYLLLKRTEAQTLQRTTP